MLFDGSADCVHIFGTNSLIVILLKRWGKARFERR